MEGEGEGERSRASATVSSSGIRLRVRPDPFLVLCRCFNVVTAFTAIICAVINVLSAIRSFKVGADVFSGIFLCYAVLMAVLVVVVETEWRFITKFWKVLKYWVGRGMLQTFVAVMTRAFPDYTDANEELILLQNISLLVVCCMFFFFWRKVLYVFLGILCIGCLKCSRQHKEISRDQATQDLEDLERQREELEYMLVEGRA